MSTSWTPEFQAGVQGLYEEINTLVNTRMDAEIAAEALLLAAASVTVVASWDRPGALAENIKSMHARFDELIPEVVAQLEAGGGPEAMARRQRQ